MNQLPNGISFLEKQHYCPFTVSVLIDDNFVGIFINWSYLGMRCFFFFSLSLVCHETLKVVGISFFRWDRCKGTRVLLPASVSSASNLIY